jgi:subtilisin-like proprotein convertase family protein
MSRTSIRATGVLFSMTLCVTTAHAQTHVTTFTNAAPITIGTSNTQNPALPGNPYPSTINVSGVTGVTYHMSVTLTLTHVFPADLDILLVAPNGTAVLLLSDVGSGGPLVGTRIVLDDCAPRSLQDAPIIAPGRYRPANVFEDDQTTAPGDAFPAPAPPGSHGSSLSKFNWVSPNGGWKLFVVDDFPMDDGGQINSWSLTFYDQPASPLPLTGATNPLSCSKPDYDGDGRADVAVYRPQTGQWFILPSGTSGAVTQLAWGAPASSGLGDLDVPADYDGDGVTDVAIYRRATGEWFIRQSFDNALRQVSFGAPASLNLGDTPIPADYDGDGAADLAIFRSASAQWYVLTSAGYGVSAFQFGSAAAGDNPAR